MIDKQQFKEMVNEVLEYLDPVIPYSVGARDLLILTAAHESRLGTYVRQVKGPALGVMQMEPATHKDLWHNFLAYKDELSAKMTALQMAGHTKLSDLKGNLYYQIAMSRVHYFRAPARLPQPEDFETLVEYEVALATYWKRFYNTYKGKGEVDQALKDYRRYGK